MDNVILGLLLLSNRTIYQLRDRIGKGLNLMFSSSMGSIQAAIRKLLKNGLIDFEETVENGKYKKIYHITDSGRKAFFQWVNSPIEAQYAKSPEMAKVYFMGFAEKESRVAAVQEHLDFLKRQFAILNEVCASANAAEVPVAYRNVYNYQYISAVYGRDMIQFNIAWFENLLEKMEANEI